MSPHGSTAISPIYQIAEEEPSVVAVVDSENNSVGAGVPLSRHADVHSNTELGFGVPLTAVKNRFPPESKTIATMPAAGTVTGRVHSTVSLPVQGGVLPVGEVIAARVPLTSGIFMIV